MTVLVVAASAILALACDTPDIGPLPTAPEDTQVASPARGTVVIVSGVLDPAGDRLLRLNPAVRTLAAGPVPSADTGRYVLRVNYEGEREAEYRFDGLVADDAGHTQHGFFEVFVTEDEPIRELTIFDTRHDGVLATIQGADILE